MVVAGSAAPETLFRRFDRFGVRVIQPWGMTETAPIATVCDLKPHMERWSDDDRTASRQAGSAFAFHRREGGRRSGEIPWDGTTSASCMCAVPGLRAVTSKHDPGDRLDCRRLVSSRGRRQIDPEGYVKITDRVKDLIKSGGEWDQLGRSRKCLVAHESVKEAAVIAVAHPKWQERPLAVIVLKDGCQLDDSELRNFLSKRFARWQLPDAFVFVEELPHTATGKLLKSKLRQDFDHYQWEPS